MARLFTHGPVPDRLQELTPADPERIGPYRVAGLLGAGGMGAVYAAADSVGRCVAVKVVHPEYAADADFRARFAREAALMRRVGGACTVTVFDADTGAARPWIATEYVPGPTLRQRVRDGGPLVGGDLAAFAGGVAEALHAVHAAGVVHRDLKPGNVILAPDGPRVLDFGIARAADGTAITRTGALMGTPGWIAPELLRNRAPGPAADMFAWGGLVAYAATGRPPFGTGGADTVVHRTLSEPPDLSGLPDWARPVVSAALDKDPARRPTAAQALREVGGRWLGQAAPTLVAEPPTMLATRLMERAWSPARAPVAHRRSWSPLPTLLVAAAVLVAVPAVGAGGYALGGFDAGSAAEAGTGADGPGGADTADGADPADAAGGTGEAAVPPDAEAFTQVAVAEDTGLVTAVLGDDTFVSETLVITLGEVRAEENGVLMTGVRAPRAVDGPVRRLSSLAPTFTAGARGTEVPGRLSGATGADATAQTVPGTFTAFFPGAPERGTLVFEQRLDSAQGAVYATPRLCYDTATGFSAPGTDEECPA
ncbi:serine/threonine-protein kinase [Nocardiopsis sp. NPDC050513]|uniref:serine/threonine-protein kinase n=1 Tax=Nocardiopsis sp. NPDC050513 TaxID=3364338 RepID=UPI00378EB442